LDLHRNHSLSKKSTIIKHVEGCDESGNSVPLLTIVSNINHITDQQHNQESCSRQKASDTLPN
jgi:hypothetical protein